MLTEIDQAVRLTAAVLIRREQTAQSLEHVGAVVRATELAIQQSRKLLAANEIVLGRLLGRREVSPDPLSATQLDELARLVAKARGGYAFVWNPSQTLPVFNPGQSATVQ